MNVDIAMENIIKTIYPKNRIMIREMSSIYDGPLNSLRRTFGTIVEIEKKPVLIFMFCTQEYFTEKVVHLELVDSIQCYQEVNRSELYQMTLHAYFYTCSCRGFESLYFESCPPKEDSYLFVDKPSFQKHFSDEKLIQWCHSFIAKGCENQVFQYGCDMTHFVRESIPSFFGDLSGIDKKNYFYVMLKPQQVIENTIIKEFDTLFDDPEEFKKACMLNSLSFQTLEDAKAATERIIQYLKST